MCFSFQSDLFVFLLEAIKLLLHQINLFLGLLTVQLCIINGLLEIIHIFFQFLPSLFLILQPANSEEPNVNPHKISPSDKIQPKLSPELLSDVISNKEIIVFLKIYFALILLVLEVIICQFDVVNLQQQPGIVHGDVFDLQRGMNEIYCKDYFDNYIYYYEKTVNGKNIQTQLNQLLYSLQGNE